MLVPDNNYYWSINSYLKLEWKSQRDCWPRMLSLCRANACVTDSDDRCRLSQIELARHLEASVASHEAENLHGVTKVTAACSVSRHAWIGFTEEIEGVLILTGKLKWLTRSSERIAQTRLTRIGRWRL